MTNSYTNLFGAITVYPSQVGLINLTITQNTTLVWPDMGEAQSAVAASFIRATAGAGLAFTLPSASSASVGKAIRIKNIGSNAFDVKSASGSTILTASAGQDSLLSITDNTTTGGAWDVTQLGSGTTSAVASALAGNGLAVSGSVLVDSMPVITFSSTPYTIGTTGRANLYEWQGGAGVVNLPLAASAGNGWFTQIKNNGTGVLTVSAAVDGSVVALQPGNQSLTVDSDGAAWHSYGHVNLTALNPNSTYTKTLTATSVSLTTTEAQNNIINFAGTLSGNTVVNFPNNTFIYDLTNSTNGAFSLTVQPSNGTGVAIPAANTRLVTNNASTMYFSDTITGSSVIAGTGLSSATSGSVQTLSVANTTVTSGVYGDTHNYAAFTVNAQGQLTSGLAIPFSGLTFTGISLVNPTITGTANITGSNIVSGSITNSNLAVMNNNTVKGNNSGGAASPSDLTAAQLTALINIFTSALPGTAPASSGGTSNFLRADGSWNAPPAPSTPLNTWATFTVSGGACTLSGSLNVSGVTYSSTGIYIVNFTSSLADTKYAVNASCVKPSGNGGIVNYTTKAVGSVVITAVNATTAAIDPSEVSVIVVR